MARLAIGSSDTAASSIAGSVVALFGYKERLSPTATAMSGLVLLFAGAAAALLLHIDPN
jgi:hypothetical protein